MLVGVVEEQTLLKKDPMDLKMNECYPKTKIDILLDLQNKGFRGK